jgi:sugar lactone lactonase YvrE
MKIVPVLLLVASGFASCAHPRGEEALSPGRPVSREAAMPLLKQARARLVEGDLHGAMAALERALAAVPGDAGLTFNLAQIAVRAGDDRRALSLLGDLAGRGLGFHPSADPAFEALSKYPEYRDVLDLFDRNDPVVERGRKAFVLGERDLFPEGIACSPSSRTLFVGSILKRKILRIEPDGTVAEFVPPRDGGLLGVLGVKVDERRGALWAAGTSGPEHPEEDGRSGLFRFDLATGRPLSRYLLPADTRHNLNDLALDVTGSVFATDTATGAVYELASTDGVLEEFLPEGTFAAPNGIAVSDDGHWLYVASAGRGLSAVDLASRRVVDVAAPPDVVTLGIDGLYVHGSSLIAVQNGIGRGRVVRYDLQTPLVIGSARVLESRRPDFEVPTTGALCGDDFFYLANSQVNHTDDRGAVTPDASLRGILILELRLRS